MKGGATQFIDNVNSQLLALAIDELVFPVTVNEREWQNSYVCSPYSHYITYTKEELYTLNTPLLEQVLKNLLNGMGVILQLGQINQVVIVNNWLLSTNLYPNLSKSQIATLTTYLQEQFPKHTVIFRSINTYLDDCLFTAFQDNGYHLIGSRQIYLYNPQNQSPVKSKMRWRLKQDFNLIEKQGYEVIQSDEIPLSEIPRLVELYNALYLEKYSKNNPQFNANLLELALKNKAPHLQALRKAGKIDGVIGFYEMNGMMTTPILGYDTRLPQSVGLYRMLSAQLTLEATRRGIILHQSSGAASFKRFRGFVGNIEYSAVFYQHLPFGVNGYGGY
uniref:GNAT family N-acetyltransferase n=1 Tax=Desertifilum tharense IPPAS B-1220 TaxID=1781255 RepID=A0ACD5GW16_9CYAN